MALGVKYKRVRGAAALGVVSALAQSTSALAQEPDKPKLSVGVGLRTGLRLDLNDEAADGMSLSLDDGLVDQFLVRPYLSGQLTDAIGFTANFEAGSPSGLGIQVMDAIAQIKFAEEFQLWVGQHIPANDRNNMNGPFFHNMWNFPITVQSHPFDRAARDRGFTLWGLVGGGVFKYHLSMVDLQPSQSGAATDGQAADPQATAGAGLGNARFAGRATVQLWEPENYYYTSGTYYGKMDVLAIGVVAQYQKGVDALADGVDLDNDYVGFSADLLMEKNLAESGTLTVEAGYWNLEGVGDDYVVNAGTVDSGLGVVGPAPGSSYMASVSWLTPEKIGWGQVQPGARLQVGDYGADQSYALDLGVGYIIDGFNNRWHLNYRHLDGGDGAPSDDWVQLGAQFQM